MSRILIIDDNATILENTADLLELEGYETFTASNGRDGLKKAQKYIPELILSDLRMPEMDGFTVLKRLGDNPDLKRIPFVFFSAKCEKSDIKMGLGCGAVDYLTKPFELESLLKSIEKCLLKKMH